MKIKLIVIIGLCFLLCGCSVEYHLTINGNNLDEVIKISSNNSEELKSIAEDPWPRPAYYDVIGSSETPVEIEGISYYQKSYDRDVLYKYTFNRENFIRSRAFNWCFENVAFNALDAETLIISTGFYNLCFDDYPTLSDMIVKITVDEDIKNHNADELNGNTLIWNYNRSNYKDKSIQAEFTRKTVAEEIEEENKKAIALNSIQIIGFIILFGGGGGAIVLAIVMIVKKQSSKNNKI